ncbi:hypothetical protein L1987_43583 [Smallanthus sonchifolius]|uniref:Uncharacterized protein n=1 Tax=Smallanthus sonchifolius TaxID=185202 RepID=A0ACB9GLW5_9ASTR|nr:hypothetical protein L1987_43583 [Smallanthus sonchifolius]
METATSSEEVLVCQTCGAEGFTNAFVYCVKCLGFVIHRYCLDVIPKTPDELVIWYCDDCNSPLPYHFTSPPKHDPSQSYKEDPPNSALVKTTHPKKKQKKKQKKKRKIGSLVAAGKDNECVSGPIKIKRCLVLGLASRKHKSNHQKCVETSSNSLSKEPLVNSDSGANQITPQSAELDNFWPMKGIVKRKRDTIRVAVKTKKHKTEKSIEPSSCESSCTDVTLKNEEGIDRKGEGLKCEPDQDKLVSNSSSVEKKLNERSKEFNDSAFASQSTYLENNTHYIHHQPARPILDPVWRGSFNITEKDYDLFEGFVGHLSNKACLKVCEEATTLPSMLSLEMDSKAHLWPKSFLDSLPSDENIALYFFPGDTKNERRFEQLVSDMIDGDLAMSAASKNAELLIFTSKVLPQSYWRFNGYYYLWGVFRRKKDVPPVLCAITGDLSVYLDQESEDSLTMMKHYHFCRRQLP